MRYNNPSSVSGYSHWIEQNTSQVQKHLAVEMLSINY